MKAGVDQRFGGLYAARDALTDAALGTQRYDRRRRVGLVTFFERRLKRTQRLCLHANLSLGRLDSNQRMAESKSAALPLGDVPTSAPPLIIACGPRPLSSAPPTGRQIARRCPRGGYSARPAEATKRAAPHRGPWRTRRAKSSP